MILDFKWKIGTGAFSDVFRRDEKVYKLFFSAKHQTPLSQSLTEKKHDIRRHNVFQSEIEAYQRASEDNFLSGHIPNYYGSCQIEKVFKSNNDISTQYNLEDCYAMEFVAGKAEKFGNIDRDQNHIKEMLLAFQKVGIKHYVDASVFHANDPIKFKFIDFGIKEYELFCD